MPGGIPGGYGGMGQDYKWLALAQIAQQQAYGKNKRKMQNAQIGSAIGAIAGSFIPGVGPLVGSLAGGFLGGLFAEGGRPPVGRWSLVGERGPELIKPMTPT